MYAFAPRSEKTWLTESQDTGNYYNFSNIRFAQPPIGELRWAPPKPPKANRTVIHDGQDGRVCPSGTPQWGKERGLFTKAYLSDPKNISDFTKVPAPGINPSAQAPAQSDGRAMEDCLFLDVFAPTNIFKASHDKKSGGAPVLVWIYGGGFYEGNKGTDDPSGIIARSMNNPYSSPGVVFVAMNYRLGALGWLSGPTFAASGGTMNAGFYDQRLALEWVQKYIHLFGGDANRVTVMGASAGGSSILHHITAYAGEKGPAPFHQAFPQSPAFNPNPYNWQQESNFNQFLRYANVSSLAELRKLPSAEAVRAMELAVWNSTYGSSGGAGPVVDGIYTPALPAVLLAQGRYAKNVKAVFSGHNTDEGNVSYSYVHAVAYQFRRSHFYESGCAE